GLPGQPNVEETMLVDDHARVVTSSADRRSRVVAVAPTGDLENEPSVELPSLRFPKVRNAIEAKRSGFLSLDTPNGNRIVTFHRLSPLGWYYVVVADPARLAPAKTTFSAVDRAFAAS